MATRETKADLVNKIKGLEARIAELEEMLTKEANTLFAETEGETKERLETQERAPKASPAPQRISRNDWMAALRRLQADVPGWHSAEAVVREHTRFSQAA